MNTRLSNRVGIASINYISNMVACGIGVCVCVFFWVQQITVTAFFREALIN